MAPGSGTACVATDEANIGGAPNTTVAPSPMLSSARVWLMWKFVVPPLALTMFAPVPMAVSTLSVPATIVVAPVWESAPVSVSVPEPALVSWEGPAWSSMADVMVRSTAAVPSATSTVPPGERKAMAGASMSDGAFPA